MERGQVLNKGQYFIDELARQVVVGLLPAVYPHHIVGMTRDGKLVNISISGLSGRSGISIQDAKSLSIKAGLTDALIFDNGNDVIARLGGGSVICHKKNTRQTRLTAALHFGSLGTSLAGFAFRNETLPLDGAQPPECGPLSSKT
jgi:hypothetical protein